MQTATHYQIYRSQIPPLLQYTVALLVLFGLSLLLEMEHSIGALKVWNWIFPVLLISLSLWTAFRLFRAQALLLWTPTPWFLAATSAYSGMGTLLFTFGQQETIEYVGILWTVTAEELWYTNMLNLVGSIICMTGILLGIVISPRLRTYRTSQKMSVQKAKQVLFLFLAVGIPIRYFVALPYEFGVFGLVLPGSVFVLKDLILAAILVLGYLSVKEGGQWRVMFIVMAAFEMFITFLTFSKLSFMTVPIMAMLGLFFGHRRFSTILAFGVALVGIYIYLIPIVNHSRDTLYERTGKVAQATFSERIEIIRIAIPKALRSENNRGLKQGWWARLSMNNSQAFAMNQYDAGLPGDSLKLALYTFIPRILWPEKPVITDIGFEFSELALGLRTSSTGIGVYGEAYWNGGWLTVLWTAFLVGLIFAFLSQVALFVMSREEWIFLPCVFLGIRMGFRIDGWFASDYIGTLVFYVYFLVFLYVANLVWSSLQRLNV